MNSIVVSDFAFTDAQRRLILDTCCNGAPEHEAKALIAIAEARGLNPLLQECYFVSRWDSDKGRSVWAVQASIDSFRIRAEASGVYDGQDEPEYEYDKDGKLVLARVKVWRKDWSRPSVGVARYAEYVQTKKDGTPTQFWRKSPHNQVAKCFDAETDVLTDRGFQRFARADGRILQVTPDGLRVTDAVPFCQAYDGPMVEFESDDLNFSVTPNHDMITSAGRIEAAAMYDQASTVTNFRIPRLTSGNQPDTAQWSDDAIVLAAAYLCDGSDASGNSFVISVSRPRKIECLRGLALHDSERGRDSAGDQASGLSGRTVRTTADKRIFRYAWSRVASLVGPRKTIYNSALLTLSRRQARLFVDAMVSFDGHRDATSGVRRFYSSRPEHIGSFELAAVCAGYAVSDVKERRSDLSESPNYYVTVSPRDEVVVKRWGKGKYGGGPRSDSTRQHLSLNMRDRNASGRVWCVTVPSGAIVVRRHGFSMLCGNCAEALAFRKAFPKQLAKVYIKEEAGATGETQETDVAEPGDTAGAAAGFKTALLNASNNETLDLISKELKDALARKAVSMEDAVALKKLGAERRQAFKTSGVDIPTTGPTEHVANSNGTSVPVPPRGADGQKSPASSSSAATTAPPDGAVSPSTPAESSQEPATSSDPWDLEGKPKTSERSGVQTPPARDWQKEGQALWDRAVAATSLDALTVILDEVNEADKAGAPSTKAIRNLIADKTKALEPPAQKSLEQMARDAPQEPTEPKGGWPAQETVMEGWIRSAYAKGTPTEDKTACDQIVGSFMKRCPAAMAQRLAKFLREAKTGKLEPEVPFR